MFLTSFLLPSYVSFHILGRFSVASNLGRVALCSIVLWCPVAESPWSPKLGGLGCLLCGLCVPSRCSLAVIAVSISVGGINPHADWLSMTTADELLCGG